MTSSSPSSSSGSLSHTLRWGNALSTSVYLENFSHVTEGCWCKDTRPNDHLTKPLLDISSLNHNNRLLHALQEIWINRTRTAAEHGMVEHRVSASAMVRLNITKKGNTYLQPIKASVMLACDNLCV